MRIDLTGKRALVAGVADDTGFGFAIAKSLAEAGASVCIAAWPPAMNIFETLLRRGKMDDSRKQPDGSLLTFEGIYPVDAMFDVLADAPEDVRSNKRYAERGDFSIQGLVDALVRDFGPQPVDIVVHSLANGPEVARPLMDTSRKGYLAALSASSYSMVSMVQRFAPVMKRGSSFLSLTYMASERVIPRYGGGMSTAKAALECDTKYLAFEAGRRHGVRVNTISAGPYASRAASVTGAIDQIVDYYQSNSPLQDQIEPIDVGTSATFLCSPLARAITGTTLYVDYGWHSMGKGLGPNDEAWALGHKI